MDGGRGGGRGGGVSRCGGQHQTPSSGGGRCHDGLTWRQGITGGILFQEMASCLRASGPQSDVMDELLELGIRK